MDAKGRLGESQRSQIASLWGQAAGHRCHQPSAKISATGTSSLVLRHLLLACQLLLLTVPLTFHNAPMAACARSGAVRQLKNRVRVARALEDWLDGERSGEGRMLASKKKKKFSSGGSSSSSSSNPQATTRASKSSSSKSSSSKSGSKASSSGDKKKPPPPTLRVNPFPPVKPPPPPFRAQVPPDLPPPPYPPQPPPLKEHNYRVNNFSDVCAICTAIPYNGTCSSTYASSCISAMNSLRQDVWRVQDRICDCYTKAAVQLIRLCPGIQTAVSYLGNCDPNCFYGPRCPFVPTVYALLAPDNVVNTDTTIGVDEGSGMVVFDLFPSASGRHLLQYEFHTSGDLQGSPLSAAIYSGTKGSNGKLELRLFTPPVIPDALSARVPAVFQLFSGITTFPTNYYIQMDTTGGSLRGQILFVPHLFSLPTSQQVPVNCGQPGAACSGVVNMAFTPFAVYYDLAFTPAVGQVLGAAVVQGVPGDSGAKLFDMFGPGISAFSASNGITPDPVTIESLLADPNGHYIYFTSQALPYGALRGQFTDNLKVASVMYGYQVVYMKGTGPTDDTIFGSGVPGSAFFSASLGAGGLCYWFTFYNIQDQPLYAYLHQGEYGKRGPIVVWKVLQPTTTESCVSVDSDVTASILQQPQNFYIQVYTRLRPGGALRGQLHFSGDN